MRAATLRRSGDRVHRSYPLTAHLVAPTWDTTHLRHLRRGVGAAYSCEFSCAGSSTGSTAARAGPVIRRKARLGRFASRIATSRVSGPRVRVSEPLPPAFKASTAIVTASESLAFSA